MILWHWSSGPERVWTVAKLSTLDIFARKMRVAPFVQSVMLNRQWPDGGIPLPNPYRHDSHTDNYFHPSVHAMFGEKAIYHTLHPELRKELDRSESYTRLMTPLMGTMVHTLIQQKLILAGLVEEQDVEISLVNEQRHWRGHVDLVFRGDLCDIKTKNSFGFQRLTKPDNSWIYQLNPYMDEMGKDEAVVLVSEMGIPWGFKEFVIPKSNQVLDEIYSKWERVTEALKNNEEPRTCCYSVNATYCPINCGGAIPPRN